MIAQLEPAIKILMMFEFIRACAKNQKLASSKFAQRSAFVVKISCREWARSSTVSGKTRILYSI